MRKLFVILLITATLCGSLFAETDTTVIITKSGTKYHRANCRTLRSSRIELRLEEAMQKGYEPCAVCNPPLGIVSESNLDDDLYRVNLEDLQRVHDADISKMIQADVVRVVDGDTLKVLISNPPSELAEEETIRLLGVDTPETVHPSNPVEHFGEEASNFSKSSLEAQQVYLAFDWDLRDNYDRLLAYVYLQNGLCHNAMIIQQGYGFAYLTYPFQIMDEFEALQGYARDHKAGMWK